jgi:hypothetical protein
MLAGVNVRARRGTNAGCDLLIGEAGSQLQETFLARSKYRSWSVKMKRMFGAGVPLVDLTAPLADVSCATADDHMKFICAIVRPVAARKSLRVGVQGRSLLLRCIKDPFCG